MYHSWLSIFGFSHYWPLRFTGIGSHLAIAVILYLIIRPRLGPAAALVAGTVILWFPGVYLIPSVFNHWFALAASLVCAWALTRDGRVFCWGKAVKRPDPSAFPVDSAVPIEVVLQARVTAG